MTDAQFKQLSDQISQQGVQIDALTQAVIQYESQTNARMDMLDVKIDSVETGLIERIDSFETGATNHINSVEVNLTEHISSVETNVTEDIISVGANVTNHINCVEISLTERINTTSNEQTALSAETLQLVGDTFGEQRVTTNKTFAKHNRRITVLESKAFQAI